MTSIVSAIIVLGILIFVHELGHFIFAKIFKVGVEKFSLGFGPKLFGKRIGETEYLISAFPLGGYVKMVGEAGDEDVPLEDHSRSFLAKPPWQRILIVVAGPLFNLVFAYLAFISVFMIGVPFITSKIGEVVKDKPAARAGLKANDVVVAVNDRAVSKWSELSRLIVESGGKQLDLKVDRGGQTFVVRVAPEITTQKNLLGDTIKSPAIGIAASNDFAVERFGGVESFTRGSEQTWDVIRLTYVVLGRIVTGTISLDTIGGPIMIAKMAGEQADAGISNFVAFMAFLSINLGILNLLPIPILDGGHLLFYAYEWLFRKPVSMKARELLQQVGLVLLIGLMFLAFYNDIVRYFVS
ncbi:MAG TPA: RIP metalloprotease RseP [Geobacteraceae bacterium]|jgi:regulator of sigma E protease|nr:RIP metalloprotease RseP [Geobacteraceae bacterium]